MMVNDYIRQDLKNFKPYHAPLKPYQIKVDANENPYGHAPKVIEQTKLWLEEKDNLTRYPDTDSTALRTKLGQYYDVTPDQVICGVGSDQLIEYITKLFIEPGDRILVPNPSFSMYGISNALNHGVTIKYELNEDFTYDVSEILARVEEAQPKVLFLCTPNNPTGSIMTNEQVLEVLEAVDCPVVLDEAYDEFVEDSMVKYIDKYPNLLILRTFSKAFACAGLRVGYGIGSVEMIEALNICKSPYNLPSFSQAVATYILESVDFYKEKVELLKKNRDILHVALEDCGLFEMVYPSKANFILVKAKDMGIMTHFSDNDVLIRSYGDKGRLANCMRVSVGTEVEIETMVALLNSYTK